jgi:hypothetical protein
VIGAPLAVADYEVKPGADGERLSEMAGASSGE